MKIHLGISTCPNDTFALHGVLEKRVDLRGLDFHIELLDIEQLNRRLFAGEFDVAKASFHAALYLADQLGVLPSGSALGFGVGPLLLAARRNTEPSQSMTRQLMASQHDDQPRPARVLCPGKYTTATLLYQLYHPNQGQVEQVVFSEIMPALENGRADFGVCIHEGRFTWRQRGLTLVEDLGTVWEDETSTPLPLGGILARLELGHATINKVQAVLEDSIQYGLRHRQETVPTMRRYAQEFTEEVLFSHVDLYVNEWTVSLGDTGRSALKTLDEKAKQVGIVPRSVSPLVVF